MKAKIITTAILSIIGITICSIATSSCDHVSALEYTTHYGNSFTLLPSISVSLSSASSTSSNSSNSNNPSSSANLIISDLLPNSSQDSNEIIVNVESNNSTGYVLNSSVGNNTTYASNLDNLVNTASNNYKFTNLALDADLASIDDSEENNVWGYSYSDQTVATPTWSSYSGLPLYSDTTNIATLKSSNTPSSANGDNIGFKIAAKASITQGSGEYTNIINFIAVGNPTPTSFYDAFATAASQPGSTITQLNGYYKMQDMTADICDAVDLYDDNSHIQLIDTRDNEVYWIGKLKDNRCWLLDNLRLGSNEHPIDLTPQDTNIAEDWTLPRGVTSGTNSFTEAKINANYKNDTNVTSYGAASGKVGAYYNYCAASGGTYCYPDGQGSGNAEYDICPSNWRLPTGSNDSGEYGRLVSAYGITLVATEVNSCQYNLAVPLSGYYGSSVVYHNETNGYWAATKNNGTQMHSAHLPYKVNSTKYAASRTWAFSIRCIANDQ